MPETPPRDERLRVMPWWLVLVGLLLAALLGWLVLDWLLGEADRAAQPDTRASLRIDAIRTGLTVVAGTGGGLALLLAARRQWIGERAQRHQEAVAARDQAHRERVQAHAESVAEAAARHQDRQAEAAEHDAAERRLTELYTRAVELLGSDTAAVRLGGLYALERLGQDNPAQRQTITAVLCAYLRMPPPTDDPREDEVRRTAQRLLTRHLRADDPGHWPGVTLDLTGARLAGFDASGCTLVDADLTGAVCAGTTSFAGASVHGRLALGASFDDLVCDDLAGDAEIVLDGARVTGTASFTGATVGGALSARRAEFHRVSARGATFHRPVTLDRSRFTGSATFREAVFHGGVSVERAEFAGYAGFRRAHFADLALFRWAVFGAEAWFEGARFAGAANFGRARFLGPVSFDAATLARRPLVDQARATATGPHTWPEGTVVRRLDDEWLLLVDP
ncbi:pentapeptide repeat-containing protein [Micromonospora sp. C28SCA-DRY-2]|uniref:pentapeptide repeat-containing protein n=1 Tax=Micromonospora sp. C28SCA-DRY-2 TaxID=3059522 RepID=UPI002676106D|nr:pentapeptide repeat-containing protein [Micromonospora sp. C28SCA-DRY-2]MDO3704720.1 pentapeptide repeat-containing protein [Micromonospora sp. C28SCA-DRY-2]